MVLEQSCHIVRRMAQIDQSRSLSPAEWKYAQLEKEGLAIVFGVKNNQYLLGRKFTILSDHKPLRHLFCESRPLPPMASAHTHALSSDTECLRLCHWQETRVRKEDSTAWWDSGAYGVAAVLTCERQQAPHFDVRRFYCEARNDRTWEEGCTAMQANCVEVLGPLP